MPLGTALPNVDPTLQIGPGIKQLQDVSVRGKNTIFCFSEGVVALKRILKKPHFDS
jgi:hypothetical protein